MTDSKEDTKYDKFYVVKQRGNENICDELFTRSDMENIWKCLQHYLGSYTEPVTNIQQVNLSAKKIKFLLWGE